MPLLGGSDEDWSARATYEPRTVQLLADGQLSGPRKTREFFPPAASCGVAAVNPRPQEPPRSARITPYVAFPLGV